MSKIGKAAAGAAASATTKAIPLVDVGTASDSLAVLPIRRVTINQLVGYNMAWYRNVAGLTQEELGRRLGGWTKVAVSAAERSWDGKRIRKFDADEIVAIARALGVPVPALFLPPDNAGTTVVYELGGTAIGEQRTELTELLPYLLPSLEDETPVMAAFRQRLMALGASYLADADHARTVVAEAQFRTESLERDALERYRKAMGSLVQRREELERRVDDLRFFEREYRSRLLEYVEGQAAALRDGATDPASFRTP